MESKSSGSELVMCMRDQCGCIHSRKQHTDHLNTYHPCISDLSKRDLTDDEAKKWRNMSKAEQRQHQKKKVSELQERQARGQANLGNIFAMVEQNNQMLRKICRRLDIQSPKDMPITTTQIPSPPNTFNESAVDSSIEDIAVSTNTPPPSRASCNPSVDSTIAISMREVADSSNTSILEETTDLRSPSMRSTPLQTTRPPTPPRESTPPTPSRASNRKKSHNISADEEYARQLQLQLNQPRSRRKAAKIPKIAHI
ncbi:hypothetical protein AeRB84_020105 [Aphanomyces euteiches]|nr:hypothetical protein AeRB84_020105 [Aphanomyces euteiches]